MKSPEIIAGIAKNFAICKIADEYSALRKKIDEVALANGVKSDSKFGIMLSCDYFVYQFSLMYEHKGDVK